MGFRMATVASSRDQIIASASARFRVGGLAASTDQMVIDTSGNVYLFPTTGGAKLRANSWGQPYTTQLRWRNATATSTFVTTVSDGPGNSGYRMYDWSTKNVRQLWQYTNNSPGEHRIDAQGSPAQDFYVYAVSVAVKEIDNTAPIGTIGIRYGVNDRNFKLQCSSNNVYAGLRCWLGGSSAATRYNAFTVGTTAGPVSGLIRINNNSVEFAAPSDYRLKTNVTDIQDAVQTLKQIRPRLFDWSNDGTPGAGFIAHEFQAVIRDGVTGYRDEVDDDGNPRYQMMDYRTVIPLLTASLREIDHRVREARARLSTLQGSNQ